MNTKIVEEIVEIISKIDFFEFEIYSIQKSLLTLAGSEDFSYYHDIEIYFEEIHTVILNNDFRINTKSKFIQIIDGTDEAFKINKNYKVLSGNSIFKITDEDGVVYYIAAKRISYSNVTVK